MESKSSGKTGRKSGGSSGGSDGVEGEGDQDESSSSSSSQMAENRALESFRSEWKRELADSQHDKTVSPDPSSNNPQLLNFNIEDKAKNFFELGIENEQNGNLYEAVQFYKKAFQLVPDIELRVAQQNASSFIPDNIDDIDEEKQDDNEEEEIKDNEDEDEDLSCEENEEFDPKKSDLKTHLQNWMYRHNNNAICTPQRPTYGVKHISDLPVEVILYLLRWVVSTELDLRSLEQVSAVSRGLYVCARDPEIWRVACTRAYGVRSNSLGPYASWREMFIFRSRVNTSGCYISKTTYIRPGEHSFQDKQYRPWHLVHYFRYFRFFADGSVLMLTTSEEPAGCVGLLKKKPTTNHTKAAAIICQGYYRLLEPNMVSIIVSPPSPQPLNRHGRFMQLNHIAKQTFHIELEVVTYRNKLHGQLIWRRYALLSNINGVETITDFEIIANRFPPLWFSRVKSYHTESNSPLL